MAAFMTRSSISPPPPRLRQITVKLSLSDQITMIKIKPAMLEVKRRRSFVSLASLCGGNENASHGNMNNNNNNNYNTPRAVGLQSHLDYNPDDVVFRDSLPIVSRLKDSYSSPKLRVYVAYGQSAAEKALFNCEAVLREQFDTAFELVIRWLMNRAILLIENSLEMK